MARVVPIIVFFQLVHGLGAVGSGILRVRGDQVSTVYQ